MHSLTFTHLPYLEENDIKVQFLLFFFFFFLVDFCYGKESSGEEGKNLVLGLLPITTVFIKSLEVKVIEKTFPGTSNPHWWSSRGIVAAWGWRGNSSQLMLNIQFYILKVEISADDITSPRKALRLLLLVLTSF